MEEYTKLREEGVDFLIHKKYQTDIFVKELNSKKILVEITANHIDENFAEN